MLRALLLDLLFHLRVWWYTRACANGPSHGPRCLVCPLCSIHALPKWRVEHRECCIDPAVNLCPFNRTSENR